MNINLEQHEIDRIIDALSYAAEGAADEMKYCGDPELAESLQNSIEAAEQIINKLAQQRKGEQNR